MELGKRGTAAARVFMQCIYFLGNLSSSIMIRGTNLSNTHTHTSERDRSLSAGELIRVWRADGRTVLEDRIESMDLFLRCANRSFQRIGATNRRRWGGREEGEISTVRHVRGAVSNYPHRTCNNSIRAMLLLLLMAVMVLRAIKMPLHRAVWPRHFFHVKDGSRLDYFSPRSEGCEIY